MRNNENGGGEGGEYSTSEGMWGRAGGGGKKIFKNGPDGTRGESGVSKGPPGVSSARVEGTQGGKEGGGKNPNSGGGMGGGIKGLDEKCEL